jgi:hypothetical protein
VNPACERGRRVGLPPIPAPGDLPCPAPAAKKPPPTRAGPAKTYTVTVAFYDAWNQQTVVVEAGSIEEACAKAIDIADNERVEHYELRSWDPSVTFVAGIEEGSNPDSIVIGGPIPFEDSEEAAFGAGVLRDALKTALPHLQTALESAKPSGNSQALEQLASVVDQVRRAIGPDTKATA